jgi:phenylacetate-CoA ligase
MLLIRGANVYPSAIDAVIRAHPAAGAEYRIIVERRQELDELSVELELEPSHVSEDHARIITELEAELKAKLMVRTAVRIVAAGTFDQQVFKARRVIDRR